MAPKVRFGLIVGGIGLFINLLVSIAVGLCGPFITLLAGALAGWLAVRKTPAATQQANAKDGAVAGGIAGGLMIIGQIIGAVLAVLLLQSSGATPALGSLPTNASEQTIYMISGAGAGLCFGIFGAALAAGAGALTAYLVWKAPETPSYPSDFSAPQQ